MQERTAQSITDAKEKLAVSHERPWSLANHAAQPPPPVDGGSAAAARAQAQGAWATRVKASERRTQQEPTVGVWRGDAHLNFIHQKLVVDENPADFWGCNQAAAHRLRRRQHGQLMTLLASARPGSPASLAGPGRKVLLSTCNACRRTQHSVCSPVRRHDPPAIWLVGHFDALPLSTVALLQEHQMHGSVP